MSHSSLTAFLRRAILCVSASFLCVKSDEYPFQRKMEKELIFFSSELIQKNEGDKPSSFCAVSCYDTILKWENSIFFSCHTV